jgi:mono/diheme cytochrome c family protein
MKKTIAVAAVLIAVMFCGAALSLAGHPPLAPETPAAIKAPDPQSVAQGARLAAVGDCMVCHTAKGGKPFAGGLAINTPFGKIFSTNITPDPQTGIGSWSLEAFTRAMRKGASRDGHLLYPAFPYTHFQHMNDADIAFVYAYLMSRNPVQATAPDNKLLFPLKFRPLMAGWNRLFLHPEDKPANKPDTPLTAADADANTAQSIDLQRGSYLVNGPAHCAACHTPLNLLGAEKRGQAFAGGLIDGWDAPPLTNLSQAPVPWTQQQLVQYLRTGLADQHGAAAGPMLPVTRSLADASEADVNAMAAYLLSLQAPVQTTPATPSTQSTQSTPAAAGAPIDISNRPELQSGAMLFTASCASCHSASAPMSTIGGRPSLALSTALNAENPRNAIRLILDGIDWNGSKTEHFMPAFSDMLTDAQIADIANYTRAMYSNRGPWPALDGGAVAKIRKESPKP